jgi:DNA (cytosine-5)-methyltransferase 1
VINTVENHQHSGYRETVTAATLKTAGGTNGGGSESMVVENRYIVRRLTPQECAMLQGFPSNWCEGLGIESPTDEDIAFWTEVWETHAAINGKKPKTQSQIIKWIQNPYSEAREYSLWGNGVCLNCVVWVLSGIVYYTQ